MSKKEFIESLREYLSYELPERLVSENIRKYEEYFDEQIRTGRKASEVSEELGDPKLIARSCIDAAKSGQDGIPDSEDDPNFAEEIDRENTPGSHGKEDSGQASQQGNTRVYTSRGCLVPALILIFILLIAVLLIILFFATGIGLWIILGVLIVSAVTGLIRLFSGK